MRKRGLTPFLILALCAAAWGAGNVTEVRDAVVAVVDEDVITRGQVMDQAKPRLEEAASALVGEEGDRRVSEILRATLRNIIDERLLIAEAERLVKANDGFKRRVEDRVQQQMEEERREAGGEIPFREKLKESGLTAEKHQQQARRNILREVVIYQFVVRGLSISPDEVRQYYRDNPDEFREAAQVRYRQIFVRVASPAARDGALEPVSYTHLRAHET